MDVKNTEYMGSDDFIEMVSYYGEREVQAL